MSESATSGVREMTVASAFAGMRSVSPVVFKAGCPDCRGRFELTAGALRLAIGATSRTTFYSFTCPECGASVRKPAGERIVELLTGGGVSTLRLHSTL
ncbi:CpXC domain-containing protein [Streptomyces muensis]|uniref:CpXC domain-containing protein n=1 Tax=Streptomyces muensis TaxID=1077944 RepID=A0A9X1TMU2_STRM4|nr:CpXC domain-containing protein [Streptomyces muensis]MCF1596455.1 CpXC domain-containing protein [Streptomyces muensis]